jgi:hypothetical protein
MFGEGKMSLRPNIWALLVATVACDGEAEDVRSPPAETAETRETSEGPEAPEALAMEEPAPPPDLELMAASMGSTPHTRERRRVYMAREPGGDGWPLLCSETTGDGAERAAGMPDGALLEVTGQTTEIDDEYWHEPGERRCRIDEILDHETGYSVHLPAGLGPLRGGMTHEQIASALAVSPNEVPTDTDERVFVVAGWGLVMDHDYLQFFATDQSRLPRLVSSTYEQRTAHRVDLARHTCDQPGWTGEMWRHHGWVENEATGARIAFASPGVKWSWYVSYVCGAARRLTAPVPVQGDEAPE